MKPTRLLLETTSTHWSSKIALVLIPFNYQPPMHANEELIHSLLPLNANEAWQNESNPTDGSTVIRYFIPQEASSAQLKVYSMNGEEVHSIELKQKGHGQVQL